jgi:hypothetical protein
MKKVLSVLLAGAMTASMAVSAFAADSNIKETVYNDDGEDIVGNGKDVWGDSVSVPFTTTDRNNITVDGVVPGITMYIPLAKNMSDKVTDGSVASDPTDAQKVAKLKVGSGLDFEKVTELEESAKYLNKTLDGAVTAEEGTVTKELIAAKLVASPDAEEIEQDDSSIKTTDKLLNSDCDAAIAAEDNDTEASAYHNGTKVIRITNDTPADAITKATKDVKDDLRKVTNAYNDGNYYKTSLSNDEIKTAVEAAKKAATTTSDAEYDISWNSLSDKDLFKFDVDKDDGSKYVKKIELVYDKKLSNLNQRTAFLKVILNDNQTTSDLKSTGTVTFKAKKSNVDAKVKDEKWADKKEVQINYTFWINNVEKKGSDEDADTGDRVFFNPESNEDNTFVWGDDRAAVFFEGNDDASKFYARLQTKADSEIYATYGDPVNADLWFYDFVGNPTVPSTSRATLTLGIPWDEDDDYTPNPEDCYIYEMDADGYLTDVTDRFTYDEENDGSTEIEGWTIKTRTLGTYVISDTELDVTVAEEVEEVEEEEVEEDAAAADDVKEIPNTGSSDMVGIAVVAAVASLAAAGAVAFKKASK